jgi:hypothetical protein
MSTDLKTIEERQQKRYRLFKTIYDCTGDSTSEGAHFTEVFMKAGFDEHDEEGHRILDYLYQKGLLSNRVGIGGLALSHEGIREIEQSILHPESSTEHFKPGVVQHFYAAVGAVQNAPDSTAYVTQNNESIARALDADQQLVATRKERRRQMMLRIYDKSEGSINEDIDFDDLREEEGLSEVDFNAVYDYLKAEGLVDNRTMGGGVFEITQRGIEYAERQIRHPQVNDEPASNRSEQHFHGPVGAVQNASGSTAYVTQNNVINSTELLSLIQELREKIQSLPDNEEALEQIDNLEEEARSANPKASRIKAAAKYIANIVKDVGVSVLSDTISKAAGGG